MEIVDVLSTESLPPSARGRRQLPATCARSSLLYGCPAEPLKSQPETVVGSHAATGPACPEIHALHGVISEREGERRERKGMTCYCLECEVSMGQM